MHDAARPPFPQVCVTLLVPQSMEDFVVDWLLGHDDWQIEFSAHAVQARGPLVALASDEEQVQGYAQRVELKLIIPRVRLDALIAAVEELLAGVPGGYWVTPIERIAGFPAALSTTGGAA